MGGIDTRKAKAIEETDTRDGDTSERRAHLSPWLTALVPLALLAAVVFLFLQLDPLRALTGYLPPVEILSVQRVDLQPGRMTLNVVNGGPEAVTIAQVQVDEAYWSFEVQPSATLPRLGRAEITVPYPWVQGDLHEVRLVTSTGLTFDHVIDVATPTPRPDAGLWLLFGWIGAFVGIVPVGLGLMWFPALKRLGQGGMRFVLALTIGLLIFLVVDTVLEGIEIGLTLPDVFQAVPLVFFAALISFLVLVGVARRKSGGDRFTRQGRLWIATALAIGIGLHNMGEGMAIGAAIALGEAALGSFLIIGFTLHNITEGVGIGAPMAHDRPGIGRLIGLALLAGSPAILGVWIGGFSYSPLLAVVFLAIGAGAILQVIYEVGRLLVDAGRATSWESVGGVAAGLAVMYLTALLVTF
jgi:zinc transporter ZupT